MCRAGLYFSRHVFCIKQRVSCTESRLLQSKLYAAMGNNMRNLCKKFVFKYINTNRSFLKENIYARQKTNSAVYRKYDRISS